MKIDVSIPEDLIAFADHEAERLGISRSSCLVKLLEVERARRGTRRYVEQHGWDVAEDEETWRSYQKQRMAQEYPDDEW